MTAFLWASFLATVLAGSLNLVALCLESKTDKRVEHVVRLVASLAWTIWAAYLLST